MAQQGLCTVDVLDPEDPRCARVVFAGKVALVENNTEEFKFAQAALFERHPTMSSWPDDHSWHIQKLQNFDEIWLIDIYGGGINQLSCMHQ